MSRIPKPEEDAFGHEIFTYYKNLGLKDEEVFEIIERDDGYITAMSPKFYFSKYEDWSLVEKKALTFVKGRVLDIGCGAGRHILYLQRKNFKILGIDNSPLAIKVCKLRGVKKAEIIPIENMTFKSNSFDTIIMMGNNFGLFGNFKKAQKLLKKIYKMTSKNALIIADTRDPYKTKDPAHLSYHKLNRKKSRMSGQIRIRVRFQKYVGKWFDYLMVSKKELKEIIDATGWKIKKIIDSDNSEYIAIIDKKRNNNSFKSGSSSIFT